jgi:hypothetical protein
VLGGTGALAACGGAVLAYGLLLVRLPHRQASLALEAPAMDERIPAAADA